MTTSTFWTIEQFDEDKKQWVRWSKPHPTRAQADYDKAVIQALLGHKQTRMTELYLDSL